MAFGVARLKVRWPMAEICSVYDDNDGDIYIYRIDRSDQIMSLSDNWLSFAIENDGIERNAPDKVIGQSLWDYITGDETQHLYQIVLKKVRSRKQSIRLLFRCDSPDICRYLQLSVIPLEEDAIEFRSQILRTEPRETVELLKSNVKRSDKVIKICSTCKKIAVSETEWEETEAAINTLKVFEHEKAPQLTHGLCKYCYDIAMSEINSMDI